MHVRRVLLVAVLVASLVGVGGCGRSSKGKSASKSGGKSATTRGLSVTAVGFDVVKGGEQFNFTQGTWLTVRITCRQDNLLDIDTDASTIDTFTDDSGTDLLVSPPPNWGRIQRGMENHDPIREKHDFLQATLFTHDHPAETATRLSAKGTLVLSLGKDERTVSNSGVRLVVGNRVKAGVAEFTITDVRHEPDSTRVILEGKGPLHRISGLVVRAPGGARVRSSFEGGGGHGDAGIYEWKWWIEIGKSLSEADFEVHYWAEEEVVELPYDVTVGLGLD